MLKKPGFSNSCKTVVAGSALLLGLGLASQAQAGPRIEFGEDGGFLQVDLKGQLYVENTEYGGGPMGDKNRTDIHFMRNRVGFTGMLDETWGYKLQTCGNTGTTKMPVMYGLSAQDNDWNDRDVRVIDAYVIGNLNEHVNLKIGLTKIPLTRANLDDCFAPLSQDRSMFVYSAYGTSPAKFSRDLGAMASGRFLGDRLTYFAGIFQGREGTTAVQVPLAPVASNMAGVTATSTTAPKTSLEYVGRVTYDFLESEGGSGYQGTYFGEKKILNFGVGMAYQPDAAYRYTSNTVTYSDGSNAAGAGKVPVKIASTVGADKSTVDYTAFAADMLFEYPTAFGVPTITAQYLKVDFEDAYLTSTASAERIGVVSGMNGQKEGYYIKAAHILPMTVGKAGKIQPYVLYEDWKFAHLLGVNSQKIIQSGGGINYYVTGDQRVRLTGEFLKTDFDKPANLPVPGTPSTGVALNDFNTFRMMVQVVF
ncbi:MAG: hypothetical protein HGB32_01830 [Geobacteraceae bacterium]|nr:hypothetical protein [Geobacteraceae bacterium]NTW78872.1 hypothetical protein [Geobacteraceae bacterium]